MKIRKKKRDYFIYLRKKLNSLNIKYKEEFLFHPKRRWRFDLCLYELKIAFEIQGGLFNKGRHTKGSYLVKEYEKLNTAQLLGYKVYLIPLLISTEKDLLWYLHHILFENNKLSKEEILKIKKRNKL